jgi:hypothetical protein
MREYNTKVHPECEMMRWLQELSKVDLASPAKCEKRVCVRATNIGGCTRMT